MALSDWDPTSTPQYQGAGGYNAPQFQSAGGYNPAAIYNGGADDLLAMRKALGIKGPQDNRDTQRTAVMGQINASENANRVASDQSAANRGAGAYRSGGQQGALARIGAGASAQRAGAESKIQDDYADAQRAADTEALQAAMSMNQQRNAFNQNNAQFGWNAGAQNANNANAFNQNNSQFGYNADVANADKKFETKQNNYNARQNTAGKVVDLATGWFK